MLWLANRFVSWRITAKQSSALSTKCTQIRRNNLKKKTKYYNSLLTFTFFRVTSRPKTVKMSSMTFCIGASSVTLLNSCRPIANDEVILSSRCLISVTLLAISLYCCPKDSPPYLTQQNKRHPN